MFQDLMEDSEENLAVETPAPESPFSFKSSDEESEDTLEIEGAETNFDVVMDVVSQPVETAFLKKAQEKGCLIISIQNILQY